MTATVTQAREALADALAAVEGLREVYPRAVTTANAPCAFVEVGEGAFLTFKASLDGARDLGLVITLIVGRGQDRSSSELLDSFLADSGPTSIYAAVEADPTLGGVVESAAVMSASNYGTIPWSDGTPYLGCQLLVDVFL